MKETYIFSAKRTPVGSFMGSLSTVSAPKLGSIAAEAAIDAAIVDPKAIDECIVGNVLSAGLGQAPARQVALFTHLPDSVRAMTVNKVCGSGLKTVSLAAERIAAGKANVVLAGGIESMSQAPYYLTKARAGMRMGHGKVIDGMIHDGLWDVYNDFHMGNAAEMCAKEYRFTREEQDAFAASSYLKALKAIETDKFKDEIAPVEVPLKQKLVDIVDMDEEPGRGKIDKFPKLKPVFEKDGTVTAANASTINDGAAMVVVGSDELKKTSSPIAKIIHTTEYAQKPEWFTTAPIGCIHKLLKETSLKISDIDHFEVNEAFAVVAMAAVKELGIPAEKLNPRGGAIAMGHPIGASGARLLTTLVHALTKGQKGIVCLCIGGGEAIAMLVEKL